MVNETNIAYMCPACEKINIFKINIFSFSGNRKKTFECSCGHSEINFTKNANKSIKTDFICPICNEEHSFVIPANQFWSSESFSFPCRYYEATSLIIGKADKLEEAVKELLKNEYEPEETLSQPQYPAMEKIVSFIDDVENNRLKYKFCDCDEKYVTAYNDNAVYIICDKCGYSKKVSYREIFEIKE